MTTNRKKAAIVVVFTNDVVDRMLLNSNVAQAQFRNPDGVMSAN